MGLKKKKKAASILIKQMVLSLATRETEPCPCGDLHGVTAALAGLSFPFLIFSTEGKRIACAVVSRAGRAPRPRGVQLSPWAVDAVCCEWRSRDTRPGRAQRCRRAVPHPGNAFGRAALPEALVRNSFVTPLVLKPARTPRCSCPGGDGTCAPARCWMRFQCVLMCV